MVMLGVVVIVLLGLAVVTNGDEEIGGVFARAMQHDGRWRVAATWLAASGVFFGWGALIGAVFGMVLEACRR